MKKLAFGLALALVPFIVLAAGAPEPKTNGTAVATAAYDSGPGVLIAAVAADSPAQAAGIIRGDVLLAIDGTSVESMADVQDVLADHRGGDEVKLLISRGGKEMTIPLTLETRLYHPAIGIEVGSAARRGDAIANGRMDGRGQRFGSDEFGEMPGFGPMGTAPDAPRGFEFGFAGNLPENGSVVVRVAAGSPAATAGLEPRDIIVAVDGSDLGDQTIADVVAAHSPGDSIELSLLRVDDSGNPVDTTATVTLGTGDNGQAYLGIAFVPIHPMMGIGVGPWSGDRRSAPPAPGYSNGPNAPGNGNAPTPVPVVPGTGL